MTSIMYSAHTAISYSAPLEAEIARLVGVMTGLTGVNGRFPLRWLAIQLLEGDETLLDNLAEAERKALATAVAHSRARLHPYYGEDVDLAITDERYQFVHQLVTQVLTAPRATWSLSDRIDRVITNRWLGIPIFLVLMYVVFSLVQNVSAPFLEWVDGVFGGPITRWALALLTWVRAPEWFTSLLTDGVIAGVGAVLTFLPGLLVMYLALAILEDTGYLARAAFVMDRSMSKLGLHGRSFVPMILGFGCNVPAIYATRTIESKSARILTGMLIPFMSCSARLPVYVIFGLAFFPRSGNLVIWVLYLIGIAIAAVVGILLSRTLFRHEPVGILLMEMPAYRWPSARRVLAYAWEESASFVRKAGSFILLGTVIFWLLLNLPWGVARAEESLFGRVSGAVAPVLAPAGFGNWQASGALLTGLLAKEMVVSTMAQIYLGAEGEAEEETAVAPTFWQDLQEIVGGLGTAVVSAAQELLETMTPGISLFGADTEPGDTALTRVLRQAFTPLSAFAFLIFVLLYVPCIATIGAQTAEFGWRWAALSAAITLVVPWLLATLVYQVGRLAGLGV